MPLKTTTADLWCRLQGELFPELANEVGPLGEKRRRLVAVLDAVPVEPFVSGLCGWSRVSHVPGEETFSRPPAEGRGAPEGAVPAGAPAVGHGDEGDGCGPSVGLRSRRQENAKGHLISWIGCKMHIDAADGGIPAGCLPTSPSPRDSQAAIPLAATTGQWHFIRL